MKAGLEAQSLTTNKNGASTGMVNINMNVTMLVYLPSKADDFNLSEQSLCETLLRLCNTLKYE